MPSARSTMSSSRQQGTFCTAGAANLVPPLLRILLNAGAPKSIKKIQHDYALASCEIMALSMLKDEDAGFKIETELVPKDSLKADGRFELYASKKGNELLYKNSFTAGKIKATGPNVDITRRDNPTEGAKHAGVHTVHRLYMAAAFRLLLGGTDVGSNTGVAALVVSPTGEILAWGKKKADHPLLHAETSALLFRGTALPKGARIYSTLKPCKMCRAMIDQFSTANDVVTYYGQDDPTLAAMGPMDKSKFVLMSSSNLLERPIWSSNADKGKDRLLRATVAQDLGGAYSKEHEKVKDQGIIAFVKDGKVDAHLKKAANYLQVKKEKYSNEKLASTYNPNVQKCLEHITGVMRDLNLPVPVKI